MNSCLILSQAQGVSAVVDPPTVEVCVQAMKTNASYGESLLFGVNHLGKAFTCQEKGF